MAAPDREIEIGGKAFRARLSLRALAALQDHWKLGSLREVAARLADTRGWGALDHAAVLWAALRTHHREMTLEEALGMLDELGLEGAVDVEVALLGGALPAGDGKGEGEDDRPLPST